MKTKQYNGLKLIKGLSILALLIYSFTYYYPRYFGYLSPSVEFHAIGTNFGIYTVSILFVLFGFFIAQQLEEKVKPLHFAVQKFASYYPIYLIGVVLTFLATKFYLVERALPAKTMILNVTMLNNFVNYDGWGNVDEAYRTITFFFVFLVFVTFILLIGQRRNLLTWTFVWGILGFTMSMIGAAYEIVPLRMISIAFCGRYGLIFASGIAIHSMTKKDKTIFAGFVTLVSVLFLQIGFDNWKYTAVYLIGLVMILFTIAGGKEVEKFAESKWTQWLVGLSEISFPIFLLFGYFGLAIMKFLCIRLPNFPGEIIMIVPIAFVIVISSIIYTFIQKPLTNTVAKKFENK